MSKREKRNPKLRGCSHLQVHSPKTPVKQTSYTQGTLFSVSSETPVPPPWSLLRRTFCLPTVPVEDRNRSRGTEPVVPHWNSVSEWEGVGVKEVNDSSGGVRTVSVGRGCYRETPYKICPKDTFGLFYYLYSLETFMSHKTFTFSNNKGKWWENFPTKRR